MLLQQAFEMHVERAFVGDQTDRAIGQAVGHPNVFDRVLERQLERRDQLADAFRARGF